MAQITKIQFIQIIMAPEINTRQFLNYINEGRISNANSLLIKTDDSFQLREDEYFAKPLITSEVSLNYANVLEKYSFNNDKTLSARIDYIFTQQCHLLDPLILFQYWNTEIHS